MNLTDALSIKIGTADAVDVRLGSVSVWSGESLAETFLTYDSSSLGTLRNPDNSSRTMTSSNGGNWMSSVLDSASNGWWPGNWSGGTISSTNTTEWLQIDLGENQNVTGVVAQGHENSNLYYVNKYRVEYCIENSIQFSVSGMAAGTSSDTYFNSSTVSHYEVNGTYGGKIQYVASGESDSSIRYRSSDNKWEFVNDGDEYYISDTTNSDNPWAVTSWSVHPGDGSGDTNSGIVLSVDQNTFTDIDSGAEFNYDNEGDGNTKIYNSFATPVTARYITIFPTGYQGLPIMRAGALIDGVEIQLIPEFSGSSTVDWGDDTTTDALVNNTSVSHVFNPFIDSTAINGPVSTYNTTTLARTVNPPESDRSYSSLYRDYSPHNQSMLDSIGAWSVASGYTIGSEWMQIDLGANKTITGVVTQGRANFSAGQYVTSYKVEYSSDGTNWSWVDNENVFTGNSDSNTKVTNTFTTSVLARYIRIYPETFFGYPSMRAGVRDSTANNINEGSALTFNVATTNVADGTTLHYTILGNTGDFSTTSGDFTIGANGNGSFTVTPTADSATEGDETFQVQIRTGSESGTIVNTTDAITISDTSTGSASPTYDATPAATSINEGSALTINVTTTNVSDSTTLYWTILGNTGDFSTTSDSFTITSNAGSFTVTPDADSTTESSETFQVQIRTGSESGTIVNTTDAIAISDTSQTPAFTPNFELTIGSPSTGLYSVAGTDQNGSVNANNPTLAFNQGDKVRFNNGVSSSHPLYITTSSGSISNLASGVSGAGTATVDWTIPSAGTYYYQCQVHSSMYGQITVT